MRSVHTAGYKAVLAVLIEARKRTGITQEELAWRLKRPQSFVSKYESGERRIDVAEFIAILTALETDPAAWFAKALERTPSNPKIQKSRRR